MLVQPLGLRVRDGRSQTAADDARAARALELGGVAERPREVQQRVARLQLREAHRGGAHRLEHDGDGARLRVAFVHRERDALAALVDAQHDELARPDLARYLGRAHDHAGHFRVERLYSFDGIHGLRPLSSQIQKQHRTMLGAASRRSMAAIIATRPPSPCFEQVSERSAERK